MGLVIKNANIVTPVGLRSGHTIVVEAGKIVKIVPSGDFVPDKADEIVDADSAYLVPGFIDLHTHGLHEYLIDNGPDDLSGICRILPRYGVTGFLPSVCPLPKGKDAEFLSSLAKVRTEGSQIFGFHLEGPFLTLTGALPKEAIGDADTGRVIDLIKSAQPYKAIFSIAPDFDGIEKLLPIMSNDKTPVFITHTKANVKQTQAAIDSGAKHATHFYDVFPAPEENEPGVRQAGVVEAILADPRVTVDFILDGEHVDPVVVKMAIRCKGLEKVSLITDSNIGAGLGSGVYRFGAEEVEFAYSGGPARFSKNSREPGVLAGSGLTMDLALRNAIKFLDLEITQAVRMVSTNPAGVLGIDDRKGTLKEGFDADMVLLDKNLNVSQTWIAGKSFYRKGQ